MKVLVSAIIPVYNSEEFLEQCIESLRNQTLKDIEMIFINDGSTDKSLEILRRYEKVDSRIKVINQENSGPSRARNKGIERAIGEYISFIDSDDWIDSEMYNQMYKIGNEKCSDVIICDVISVKKNIEYYEKILDENIKEYNKTMIRTHMLEWLLRDSRFNSMANKLFKRELIIDNNIYLDETSDYAEDWLFNMDFFCVASSAHYLNKGYYFYRKGHESSSKKFDKNSFVRKGIWLYNQRKKYANKLGYNHLIGSVELYNSFKDYMINMCIYKDDYYKYINEYLFSKEIQEAVREIKKQKISLKDRIIIGCIILRVSIFLRLYSQICFKKSKIKSNDI